MKRPDIEGMWKLMNNGTFTDSDMGNAMGWIEHLESLPVKVISEGDILGTSIQWGIMYKDESQAHCVFDYRDEAEYVHDTYAGREDAEDFQLACRSVTYGSWKIVVRHKKNKSEPRYYVHSRNSAWNVNQSGTGSWAASFPTEDEAQDYADRLNAQEKSE